MTCLSLGQAVTEWALRSVWAVSRVLLCCITDRPWVFVDGQASAPFLSPLFIESGLCTHWRQAGEGEMESHNCILSTWHETQHRGNGAKQSSPASRFQVSLNLKHCLLPYKFLLSAGFSCSLKSTIIFFFNNFLNALSSSTVGHCLPCIVLNYTHVRFSHSTLKPLAWLQNTQDILLHCGKQNATEGLWVLGR